MRTKRILSIVLTLAMLLGMFPGMSLTASAADSTTEITPSNTSGAMTITLTIAAAQAEELLTTITATGKEQASYSTANVATVSFSYTASGSSAYLANWGWWGYGWIATVTPADGYTITKCVFYDDANRTATDSSSPFVVETTEEDKTPRINDTPIDGGTSQSKGLKKIEVYGYVTPTATHSVTITAGDHMTKTTGSGDAEQTGLTGAMTDVVYTADNGYYFPTDYSVAEVSGIKVTRDSYTQITVSGTPTADAAIALTAPTAKTDQTAPTGLSATKASSSTTTDGKISGVTAAMEYQIDGATTWTAVGENQTEITGLTAGTYKVRYAGTADKNASDATSVEVGVKEDQTAPTGLTATKVSSSTATDGKISGVNDTMEYQKDGDTSWTAVANNKTEITGLTSGTYKVRYAETADKNASPVSTVEVGVKEDQTAPTGLTATKASSSIAADGKISGVNDTMEYQKDGDTSWTAVANNKTEITGLTAGTYKVRYAETADKNASPAATAEVGVKVAPTVTAPTAKTLTYNGQAQELVIAGSTEDGTLYYAVTTENVAPTDESLYTTSIPAKTDAGTYYVWYKVVGDVNHNDSQPAHVAAKINPVDKTALTTAITEAETYYNSIKDKKDYEAIASKLKTAIDNAKSVAGNNNVTESTVSSSVTTINKARADAVAAVKVVDDQKAAEAKEAADTAAAKTVSDKIDALPAADKVTTADKTAIEAAQKAYNDLTSDQKKKVSADTLKKLTDAETALKEAEAKETSDTASAKEVSDKIDALPVADKVTTADKAAIEAARKAYDALTDDQKKMISEDTLKMLTDAEKALAVAQKKAVKSVTVNTKTVTAKTVKTTITKAGGDSKYVTTIILGKNVKKISKSAFKNYKKAKTLVVKTKKLKRSTVRNSLKGSKITRVKVKVGNKKTNKKYVKKYKIIFTKKNVGKKVKVSL